MISQRSEFKELNIQTCARACNKTSYTRIQGRAVIFIYRTPLSPNLWRHRWMMFYANGPRIGRWHSRGGLKSLNIGSLDM